MPSATDHLAASSGHTAARALRRLTRFGCPCLAAALTVAILALAGPAAAATHAGGPSPDPSPSSSGSAGPSPDPVPQATSLGSVVQGATSQGSVSQGSGTSRPSLPVQVPYTAPVTPQASHPASTPDTPSTPADTGRTPAAVRTSSATAQRSAHAAIRHRRRDAGQTAAQREAALALQQFRHHVALESRYVGPISVAGAITSTRAHGGGTLLLIGAGVLLCLAAAGGALLRKLWRLHGQWYGGKPA